ncbi:MAG TPA: hypothetical protein VF371_07920 [Candidatus Limnocylindrales bacterium]
MSWKNVPLCPKDLEPMTDGFNYLETGKANLGGRAGDNVKCSKCGLTMEATAFARWWLVQGGPARMV